MRPKIHTHLPEISKNATLNEIFRWWENENCLFSFCDLILDAINYVLTILSNDATEHWAFSVHFIFYFLQLLIQWEQGDFCWQHPCFLYASSFWLWLFPKLISFFFHTDLLFFTLTPIFPSWFSSRQLPNQYYCFVDISNPLADYL